MGEFSHFDDQGNARMVDVSGKADTERTAVARGSIFLSKEAMEAVLGRKVKKGDVFTVAQVAGIMGAKKMLGIDSPLPYFAFAVCQDFLSGFGGRGKDYGGVPL